MNTRAKGNKTELRAVKELEKEGWLVYRVKGSTKFNKNVDIFGLFDILALKGNIGPTRKKLVQCKTNNKPKLKPFKEFKNEYYDFEVEIWVYYDRYGFDKIIL